MIKYHKIIIPLCSDPELLKPLLLYFVCVLIYACILCILFVMLLEGTNYDSYFPCTPEGTNYDLYCPPGSIVKV